MKGVILLEVEVDVTDEEAVMAAHKALCLSIFGTVSRAIPGERLRGFRLKEACTITV